MGKRTRELRKEMELDEQLEASALYDNDPEEKELSVEATDIFFRNQKAKAQLVVNRGGAGSGKSHSLSQLLLYKFFTEDRKKILILRKSLPSLRISVLPLLNDIASSYGLKDRILEEKVHLNWYYNGGLIHFGSLDDPEKIKSSEWNYVWLEEATEFTFEDFKTVKLRLRAKSRDGLRNQMYLSFNPIDEFHWIKEKVVDGKGQDQKEVYDFEEIVSTYRDNPYLTSDYIEDLERLQQQDISFYNIYTLGNWGKLENLVYSNWDIVNWMPDEGAVESVVYGLDFGYNDPTALIKCYIRKTEVWEEEKLYHTGLTNSDLILKLQSIIPIEDRRRHIIYADSQEPDRIKEIKDAGFMIKPANKLILPGIDTVKRMTCHIYAGSDNLIKEKRAYSWKKDRAGNLIDEPVDFLNHLIDAERYALHTSRRRGVGIRVRYI